MGSRRLNELRMRLWETLFGRTVGRANALCMVIFYNGALRWNDQTLIQIWHILIRITGLAELSNAALRTIQLDLISGSGSATDPHNAEIHLQVTL